MRQCHKVTRKCTQESAVLRQGQDQSQKVYPRLQRKNDPDLPHNLIGSHLAHGTSLHEVHCKVAQYFLQNSAKE